MISQALEERQWREQLRAMRHLPPGTPLPGPADAEGHQLLADLLGLPDDVAPLRWLAAERGHVAALVALRELLRQLGRRASGRERAIAEGRGNPEGDDLRALVPVAPLIRLAHDPAPDADRLREVLGALRIGSRAGQVPASVAADENLQVLGDLLRAPEASDPLRWLAAERGEHVARAALRTVLRDTRRPPTASIGRSVARQRPNGPLRLRRDIRAVVDEVDFGREGFAISVRLRFPLEHSPSGGDGRRLPFWAGFDRVTDDRGYHYLLQPAAWQAGTQLRWWYRERLRMTCYPAVAAEASTLTFSALPATLTYHLSRRLGGPLQLPDEPLGDVTWRVAVPQAISASSPTR